MGQPERAEGRRARAGRRVAHHQFRQVQPVHAERHVAARAGYPIRHAAHPDLRRADHGLWPTRRGYRGRARRALGHFPPQSESALPRRQAGDGGGRQAQLRHPDDQGGQPPIPGGVRRCEARRRPQPAHSTVRICAGERGAAASRRGARRFQPGLGSGKAIRQAGDGHSHRQRSLPGRPRELRPRYQLRARSGLLGAGSGRAPRHVQLRPHHLQDLSRQRGADRGLQGGRVRLPAGVLGAGMGAHLHRQEIRLGRAGQGRAAIRERRRFPGLPHQHAPRQVQGRARTRGACARLRLRMDEPPADVQLVPPLPRLFQQQRFRGQGTAGSGRAPGARTFKKQIIPKNLWRGSTAAAVDRSAQQLARQPAEGARASGCRGMDLPRRCAAQCERRGVHPGIHG